MRVVFDALAFEARRGVDFEDICLPLFFIPDYVYGSEVKPQGAYSSDSLLFNGPWRIDVTSDKDKPVIMISNFPVGRIHTWVSSLALS